ncbi:peptidyl-prolyl cis-trans isomerase FKBP20-2, chloroplastic [Iris pallida]|uniref:Rotamase n=1 Tax=Iris pallida TaxID=29817 RepID=A0AAX6EC50_IRIPA|nr:peptidyl-prolyl cis-trans isomerase FKBP20-2, chloroplastic [Iris pallida]
MHLISPPSSLSPSLRKCVACQGNIRTSKSQKRHTENFLRGEDEGNAHVESPKEHRSRRGLILIVPLVSTGLSVALTASAKKKSTSPYNEKRLLEQNRKIQEANNAPEDFPNFVREGFEVKVMTSDRYVKRDNGLIYLDIQLGKGDCPKDGQQVTFHYIGYNESGRRIDSTYLQGSPAKVRLGNKALGLKKELRT